MALTGAIYGDKCYPTQTEALDAYYSQVAPAQLPGSGTSYVNEFVKTAGVWQIKGYSVTSAGVWNLRFTSNAPVVSFPSCDPSQQFIDGVTVGWGIATACILAAALILVKRGARGG